LALAHSLIIPLVLAAFLGLGLNPVVAAANRWHIPRAIAALVVMLALGVGVGAGVTWLAQPAANWLQRAPSALHDVAPKLKPVTQRINEATEATRSLIGGDKRVSHGRQGTNPNLFTAWDVLRMTPRILANVLTVTLLVFFFLIYGDA